MTPEASLTVLAATKEDCPDGWQTFTCGPGHYEASRTRPTA